MPASFRVAARYRLGRNDGRHPPSRSRGRSETTAGGQLGRVGRFARSETANCLSNSGGLTTEGEDDGGSFNQADIGRRLEGAPVVLGPMRLIGSLQCCARNASSNALKLYVQARADAGIVSSRRPIPAWSKRRPAPAFRRRGRSETTAGTHPSGAEAGVKERAWAVARAKPDGSILVRHHLVCTKKGQSRPEMIGACFENKGLTKTADGTALAITPRPFPCWSFPCRTTTSTS